MIRRAIAVAMLAMPRHATAPAVHARYAMGERLLPPATAVAIAHHWRRRASAVR